MPANYSLSQARTMQLPVLTAVTSHDMIFPQPGVVLDRPVCVVGARALVHLPLDSPQVSKAHALIILQQEDIYLRDLASKNQTYVNGTAVAETRLQAGDILQIGPFKYQCEFGFEKRGEPAPMSRAELYLQPDGLASHQIVAVERQTFLIGSRPGCDLLLRGADISLAHAIIFVRDGRRFLRDLSSITGTFVNDHAIREVELQSADQIRIGTSRMQFNPDQLAQLEEPAAQYQSDDAPHRHVKFDDSLERVAEADSKDLSESAKPQDESSDQVTLPWDADELELDPEADTALMGGSSAGSRYS